MCLILLSYKMHPFYPLVLAANRYEFYYRPTLSAHFWEDRPDVLAGKDLKEGGTWLGVTKKGRMAALTNYRDPFSLKLNAPSRGWLIKDFLCGQEAPDLYLERLAGQADRYNGFSLILGDPSRLYYFSNRNGLALLSPGLYGLSNRLLDTAWPKVQRGKENLSSLLSQRERPAPEDLFALLADQSKPDDDELPDTGIGWEWERILSSIFISSPVYGTRSSSLLMIDRRHRITFMERVFNGGDRPWMTAKFEFSIESEK
ncbi:MAG: NRDE family protein [Deltaproteobacteria bacterium]|nr:NRDE family protein [Deltaproteobacteria bacterium]